MLCPRKSLPKVDNDCILSLLLVERAVSSMVNISSFEDRYHSKAFLTLEMCLLPSVFIVLSFFFRLGPASSAAYHSLNRYGDE
jgi:hypothetical protein